jgi:hypothetical protein
MRRIISVTSLSAGIILLVFLLPAFPATSKQPVFTVFGQGLAPQRSLFIQVGSPTPTITAILTPTSTITPTLTSTVTSSQPAYPGITLTSPDVIQPTVVTGSETPTPENISPTEVQVSGTVSPTATLIPFPTVSMAFPTGIPSVTVTPGNSQENNSGAESLRLWLIIGLLFMWSVIIAWFWLAQRRV